MELNPTQFNELVRVLGTEPATNLLSAANITAIVSVVIAIILGVLTYLHSRYERRSRDAEFIFQSERDYGDLYKSLAIVGDWEKASGVREKLKKVDVSCCPIDGDQLLGLIEVPDEVWENARRIKTHFKSIAKLNSQKIVSRAAIGLALDHWGFRLLAGTVRKLDVIRFCHARRDMPERINEIEFQNDMGWYTDLLKLKSL